jgi:hypothetical protein
MMKIFMLYTTYMRYYGRIFMKLMNYLCDFFFFLF